MIQHLKQKMRWLLLALAIGFEICATSCLKLSKGFTVLWPSIGTVVCYVLSFFVFSHALKMIELSIAYALWCAGGIIVVTAISFFFFHEPMPALKLFFIALIVVGSVGLQILA